jgi:hypothetical protein
MRRFVFIVGLTFLVVLASGLPGDACGDKLLVLGQGVRFQVDTADYPSSLLLYINPNMPGADKVGDTQLQNITRQAGHRLRTVRSREELAGALKTGRYDIVIVDFADAAGLEELVQTSPSQPVLLPWVYQESKADFSAVRARYQAALKRYQFALKAPLKVGSFLSTIDRTMELKTKQARAKAKTTSPTNISLVH